jgi:phospholipase/lecithinase/hemolysin
VKLLNQFTLVALMLGPLLLPAQAAFTSLYVYGDGVSTTTSNVTTQSDLFHGKRYCNGRVWVEVLAQRNDLTLSSNNNLSYFGHHSGLMVTNAMNLTPPADANTSLFVLWVCDADFVDIINIRHTTPFYPTNMTIWTNGISQALSNHLTAVQQLYSKGVRSLVMPNGADVTKTPSYFYMPVASKAFVRQRIVEFNSAFSNLVQQLRVSSPGLTIISTDFFALTDQVIAQPANYGLTNSTESAVYDYGYTNFTGPGTNFVFWDQYHPTAKVQEIMADTAQALISPARIGAVTRAGGSNQLTVVNLPIGLSGYVDGTTNFTSWSQAQSFDSTNATQTLTVPINGPRWFYRLRFPFAWSWP